MELPTTMNKNKIEEAVMRHETTQKHLIGKDVKKIIKFAKVKLKYFLITNLIY